MRHRLRLWLREWLGITALNCRRQEHDDALSNLWGAIADLRTLGHAQALRIDKLEAEVVHLKLAAYIPPKPEEPPKKMIQARTWREFTALTEIEQEQESNHAV